MGDHMAVFRSLRELFPQVDTRILKAVAIEHHKDVDSAVVAVLDEVMPSMTGSVGASCALNEALASIADSVGTSSASHVTRETGSSSSAVGGSVDSAKCTSSTEVITDMQENVVGEPDVGRSPSYQGTSEQLSFPSHPVPELNDNQCVLTSELIDRYLNPCSERNSAHSENEVVHGGYIPCEYFAVSLIGENGSDSINLNVAQVQERDSNNTIPVWDCIAQDNNSLKFLCDYAEVNDVNDPFWAKIFAGVSNNEVSTGILSIEKDVFAPVLNFPIPDISESSAGPGGVLEQKDTNSNKQQSGNIVENGDTFLSSKTDLLPDLNLNHFASTASTHSNHSVNIEPLEDSIADAKNNKNDLLPSLELVTKMIEDVALLEEKAKVAKCESSVAGTGIITKVEELKEMLNHAKEANDMHAGEVFGEKSILTTEARELQSQLQRLSDERNSYLVVIEEPEHQQLIVDAGALPLLVNLLKRHKNATNLRAVNSVIRRAADAITNLAHENSNIKTCVRIQGGIPPLVELLESQDLKVQRAAAGALRTLAFDNDENKSQIVDCNALPTLILMLRSEDAAIHYEAVGVIGNLVHSSPNIKKEVLNAGALQPVIGLLSSCCMESQREAALLLGQFASADSDCKVHIVQRGAARPLIEMLQSADVQLREMSAFALGRLAQDTHNQAGIAYNGGLVPLLKLLDSKNGSLQHNAAFALYGVADNEDNVSDFIKVGGVKKLQDGEFIVQATKDCVAKTLKRLEEKINGRVLKHLVYLMRVGEKFVQRRVALALAHLCSPEDQRTIFIDNNGLDLLLDLLVSVSLKHQQDGSVALYKLANKAAALSPMDAAPPSPTPQVYLGEQYVNSSTLSDVTFLVEGKRFYAHRIALLASSDAFRAMFDGGYREKDARDIEISNIRWDVFELMMRFIYTGSVEVTSDIAQDLLRAADQYRLEGLKRLCEYTIVQDVNLDNVSDMYDLSEAFHAMSLRHTCVLFILEQFEKIFTRPDFPQLIQRVIPELRSFFAKALRPSHRNAAQP